MAEGPPWRWRWAKVGPGRRPKPRFLWYAPRGVTFIPFDELQRPLGGEPIYILPDELEALRLVYLEGLKQEEAAKRMGVSRGTLWRSLDSGRKKVIRALVEHRPIVLVPPHEQGVEG